MSTQEYRIIDTIYHSDELLLHHPELKTHGIGLLVILDPELITGTDELSGKTALVRKPDGLVVKYNIHHSEVPHGVVGIFFKDMKREEIPNGSMISWE